MKLRLLLAAAALLSAAAAISMRAQSVSDCNKAALTCYRECKQAGNSVAVCTSAADAVRAACQQGSTAACVY